MDCYLYTQKLSVFHLSTTVLPTFNMIQLTFENSSFFHVFIFCYFTLFSWLSNTGPKSIISLYLIETFIIFFTRKLLLIKQILVYGFWRVLKWKGKIVCLFYLKKMVLKYKKVEFNTASVRQDSTNLTRYRILFVLYKTLRFSHCHYYKQDNTHSWHYSC